MRYVWTNLKAFVQEDFSAKRYGAALAWLALLTTVNYVFRVEKHYINPYDGTLKQFGLYFLMYGLAYLPLFYPYKKADGYLVFWAVFAVFLQSVDASVIWYRTFSDQWATTPLYFWIWKTTQQTQSFLTIFLPLLAAMPFLMRGQGFYGLKWDATVNLKPYLWMLALMVPLVTAAAATADFQKTYPTWQMVFSWPTEWGKVLSYELAYAWDFVMTELLFRGFLVVALARLGGRKVVLAATGFYCVLHFSKPLGECISSVFGGYILGVMAYRTGNIWGGVIVHIGIALLMDVLALVMRSL